MKRSKAYRQASEQIDRTRLYSPAEAVTIAKANQVTKFDPTVEVALRLGVDPRKQDQMVRGTVNLPNGTGKTARVLVFAAGERAFSAGCVSILYDKMEGMIADVFMAPLTAAERLTAYASACVTSGSTASSSRSKYGLT